MRRLLTVLFVMGWLANAAANDEVVVRLKQIGLTCAMYADIHNELLPDLTDPARAREQLKEITSALKIFEHPQSGELFQPNSRMAGRKWQDSPDDIIYFEPRANADGVRWALFNDGHVEAVTGERWTKLVQAGLVGEDPLALELKDLHTLGAAILAYAADGNKTLPPLADPAALRKQLLPYTGMRDVFVHPGTTEPYRFNTALAGRKLGAIPHPAVTVLAYQATPQAEHRAVLFLDGRVVRLPESEWPALADKAGLR